MGKKCAGGSNDILAVERRNSPLVFQENSPLKVRVLQIADELIVFRGGIQKYDPCWLGGYGFYLLASQFLAYKLNIEKICEIKPGSFTPKPKVDSSLLIFSPKNKFYEINSKNLELITRTFFNQRRKMLKKPFNQIFNGNQNILDKLKINPTLRPQNLSAETYYLLTKEYEKLQS